MLPDILKIGSLTLHSYGLMLALAFLSAIWLMELQAKKHGLDKTLIVDLGVFVMAGSVIGSRLMYVATHWSEYSSNPWQALAVWEGGLTFYGGFILGTLTAAAFCRARKVSFWTIADIAAPGFAMGLGLGRIGCFLNGCCYGKPSSLPWAVHFPANGTTGPISGCAVHPTQIYEALFGFATFGLLWALRNKKMFPGFSICLFFLLYGLWRFASDYLRFYETSQRWTFGLSNNQWISIGIILFAIVAGLVLKSKAVRNPLPDKNTK
jgi:phosphatidylglycerol---prolipoprotein diacylglyceryl transferase